MVLLIYHLVKGGLSKFIMHFINDSFIIGLIKDC